MAIDVTPAFVAYVAGNRGPTPTDPDARERPDYGLLATLDGATIELALTFRAGAAYCCGEWQCHFLLFPNRRWEKLRRVLLAAGVEVGERLEMQVAATVESGALFLLPRPSTRTPSGLAPSKAYRYQAVIAEGDRPDAEPPAAPEAGRGR